MLVTRAPRSSSARRPVLLRLEALEERLVLSWSSVPPSVVTPTNVVAVSLNSQGDATGTAAITSNEVDYYGFTAATAGSYTISATTPSSNLDTVLGLYTSGGSRVAYNDDISSSNRDSRVTVTLPAGGQYVLGITNYQGTAGGSYSWTIDGPAATTTTPTDDSYEDNDTQAAAKSLGTLTSTRTVGNLVMADSADWFSFTTTATGTSSNSVSIAFQNSQGDLGLSLVNGSGTVISTANTTNSGESISLNGLAAGTYYVRVFGTNGAFNPSYSLTVAAPSAPTSGGDGSFSIVIRSSGLNATQQAAFDQAAARWSQIIVGDLPNATYNGTAVDDLLIDASAVSIDGAGGILGQAGPDSLRSGSRLPIHGTMQFDSADLASMASNGTLTEVILHEMGHVLGFGTIWQTLGLLANPGTANPTFTGTRAVAEYNSLFGTSATGVPVEGTPAPAGTRDGHWRESVFANEMMTGYIGAAGNPISRLTVASLADIGYTVNMAAADAYTPPSTALARSSSTATSVGGTSLIATDPDTTPATTTTPARRPNGFRFRGPRDAFARRFA